MCRQYLPELQELISYPLVVAVRGRIRSMRKSRDKRITYPMLRLCRRTSGLFTEAMARDHLDKRYDAYEIQGTAHGSRSPELG